MTSVDPFGIAAACAVISSGVIASVRSPQAMCTGQPTSGNRPNVPWENPWA